MRTTRNIAAIGLVYAVAGCEVIADIHEGKPLEGECWNQAQGKSFSQQTTGDCKWVVCDGLGRTKDIPAPEDLPDDNNPCTIDTCNGLTPEYTVQSGTACYSGPAGTQDVGQCKAGTQQCDAQGNLVGTCEGEVLPGAEMCDPTEIDEDCDGQVNEEGIDCTCEPGETIPCYTGQAGTKDVGICQDGEKSCNADGLGWGLCVGDQTPLAEDCDAAQLDEDCDSEVNEEGPNCICGDGYVSNAEQCDDNNANSTDGCTTLCKLPACGDGFAQLGANEECDDGNAISTDGCTTLCKLPACGDGYVQPGAGETCDDGGTSDGDACSPTCKEQKVLAIDGGTFFTCALLSGGVVKCWGDNTWGQLGLGDTIRRGDGPNEMGDYLPAVDLGTGKTATAISAHDSYACARLNDGSVKCWGRNDFGRLGLGDTAHRGDGPNEMGDYLPAVDLGAGKTATAISGEVHSCAILNDGSVKCWGHNGAGQLGLGDTITRGDNPGEMGNNLLAVNLGTGKTATAISCGIFTTCARLNDGSVKCWGWNFVGQLGLGDTSNRGDGPNEMGNNLLAVDLGTGKTTTAISTHDAHACARLNDGSVKCWGSGGDLGLGDTITRGDNPSEMGNYLPAVNLGTGKTATVISSSCALLNDGSAKCWGNNGDGRLGLGDTNNRGDGPGEMGNSLPVINLGSGKIATAISAESSHTCALLNDGSAKCWGDNGFGQLGLGNTADRGDGAGEMGDNLPTVKLFTNSW